MALPLRSSGTDEHVTSLPPQRGRETLKMGRPVSPPSISPPRVGRWPLPPAESVPFPGGLDQRSLTTWPRHQTGPELGPHRSCAPG